MPRSPRRRAHQPVDRQVETRGFDDDLLILRQHGIGGDDRIERLAQPPARQRHRPLDVLAADDHQIDVAIELQMLKAVVEHVDRGAELGFGEDAGAIAVGTGQHDDAGQLPRQHHRLVARHIEAGADLPRVADDDDVLRLARAAVAAAENGRLLAHLEQHPGDGGRERRLAAAADGEIADADDRVAQPLPEVGPRGVALAPPPRDRRVKAAQHGRRIGRPDDTGRTGEPVNGPDQGEPGSPHFGSAERQHGSGAVRRQELGDDGERPLPRAAIGFDQRPRRGAEAGAAHRIREQVDQHGLELGAERTWTAPRFSRNVRADVGEVVHVRDRCRAPRLASTSARAAAPRLARRTGSERRSTSTVSSSVAELHLDGAAVLEERAGDLGEVVHVRAEDDRLAEHRRLEDVVAAGVDQAAADEHHAWRSGRAAPARRSCRGRRRRRAVRRRRAARCGAPRASRGCCARRSTSSKRSGLRGAMMSSALPQVARMRWNASRTGSSSPRSVDAAMITGRSGGMRK